MSSLSAPHAARPLRGVLVSACAAVLGASLCVSAPAQDAAPARPKVIVLGFDGLDANHVEKLIAAGKLPALARLRDRGGYARMAASNPAQSPVSWASIITGQNAGKTGVTDFLRRKRLRDDADDAGAGLFDPRRIDIAFVERRYDDALSPWLRIGLLSAAALLGGIAGGALAFAGGVKWPSLRRGRPFEGLLSGGAAVFACAAFVVLRWVPEKVPTAVNLRGGEPFWVTLDRAGVRAVALEAPLCFPPESMDHGCCLAGLGVPDMAGSWGTFGVWTDDPTVPGSTEMAGTGFWVEPGQDAFDVWIGGPPNPLLTPSQQDAVRKEARAEAARRAMSAEWPAARKRTSETDEAKRKLALNLVAKLPVVLRRGEGATVTLQDGSRVELAQDKWSDLLPVVFEANPVVRLRGRVRLLLEDAGGPPPAAGRLPRPFRLFVGQVQWDLEHVPANVGLTEPRSFAKDVAASVGPIETIGWPEMTNPVKERMLSDQQFLDHTYLLMALRERRLQAQLAKGDFDVLFAMFSEPDRVQHALYRHVDPLCPSHDPEAAERFAGEIDKIYAEADRIVAQTIAAAPKDTIVLVVSDHGFAPFRRGINLNNFLMSRGLQTRRGASSALDLSSLGSGDLFSGVDWSQTKAYSLGLGSVFVNLVGREKDGVVPIDQYDAVVDEIARKLEALTDADGAKVVRRVYRGKDIYRGARADEAPDLVVGFEWGYRVTWQNCLGGLDPDVIVPNTMLWSGDHCSVDPELVPAVVFSSVPLAPGVKPTVEDVAPSVLSIFGVAPNDTDGKSFLK